MAKREQEKHFSSNLSPDELRAVMVPIVAERQKHLVSDVSTDFRNDKQNPWVGKLLELKSLLVMDPSQVTEKGLERYQFLFKEINLGFGVNGVLEINQLLESAKQPLTLVARGRRQAKKAAA